MNGAPTSGLHVRPADLADADALQELSTASVRQVAASHYTGPQVEAWAATRTLAGHRQMIRETTVLVAVDAAEVVTGFASIALTPTRQLERGEVDQLFVAPGHGGRGVARLLLDAIELAATGAGVTDLLTHSSWRAAPVFERLGFRQVEQESVQIGDQVLTRALMRKRL
ncbi:GNAT family N-acetyltransferase [Modestobacter excelsi]|uniref:GNAT family N-acetyltransferase n=1 Tax=Modestobacter excelsi TaxID=2213161 RepID=UPI001C20D2CD|nr:GNAT family N-acetyltransferase [Modestobacter excelsi]